jgi:hypothetical protein
MKAITCKPGDRVEVNILGGTREGIVEHVDAGEPLTVNIDGYEFPMLVYPAEVKRVIVPAGTASCPVCNGSKTIAVNDWTSQWDERPCPACSAPNDLQEARDE